MFSVPGSERCPVTRSKTRKNSLGLLNPTSHVLFQRPRDCQNKKVNPIGDKIWFCNAPLGTTTLDSTMKEISLVITLSETLNWKAHVLVVKNKVNRTLGCIKRNLHSCPERTKAHAYTSFRARNNGRSTDNVRTDCGFDRSNFRLAGHVDRSKFSRIENEINLRFLLFSCFSCYLSSRCEYVLRNLI